MSIEDQLLSFMESGYASSAAGEGVLIYINGFEKNMRDVSPKETIKAFFGLAFFEELNQSKKMLEKSLLEKERNEAQDLVREIMPPGAFRTYIIRRYITVLLEEGEEITLEHFENILLAWQKSKEVPKIYKDSFIRFLGVCRNALAEAPLSTADQEVKKGLIEKTNDVESAQRIVSFTPELDMPNPADPANKKAFTLEFRSMVKGYEWHYARQDELAGLADPETLQGRINELANDPLYVYPKIPNTKDEYQAPETEIIKVSDFKDRPDPENLMVECGVKRVLPKFVIGSATYRRTWIGPDQDSIKKSAIKLAKKHSYKELYDLFIDPATNLPRIKLVKFSIPDESGEQRPVYLVEEGHTEAAIAKLIDAPIVARVVSQRLPNTHFPIYAEIPNLHVLRRVFLEDLQKMGLIDADFSEQKINTLPFKVKIRKMALPWLLVFGSDMLQKFSEKAEQVWPGIYKEVKLVDGKTSLNQDVLVKNFSFRKNFRAVG